MPVMQLRIVRMAVYQSCVPVDVDMRLAGRIVLAVRMLVVLVMRMGMLVYNLLVRVRVRVLVVLDEVQP